MLHDMARGGMPAMTDRKQFTVGKDISCTPGAVVYRNEMFELLQYTPTTPKVRGIPLLMIPPQINRHYVLDLAPGRSLAEFAVSQGIGVFMIVWRKFARDSSKLAMEGWEGNGPTLLGVKTDFSKVTCDSYHVGGYTDHITAWRACYDTAQLVGGGNKEMTLIRSGHIQSVVYPADSTRYDRWYGPPTPADPDKWLETATVEPGSWWRPWTEWLIIRSGHEKAARATLGNRQYRPLTPAPGTYVYE